ncbi:hypothetical protein FDP41_004891 [Naegleria fowleri]|uniref:EF-hand domain-containing protein n=1 Tax=Naegleria fowleri TaxID=5763 RepID=A0A6A5BMQ4_NAEFO|nr:uncharacterized protein FDP41_004891 [Naegleria fowleri]KAF0976216.1 hypothetical protein FDP41_004891 [Naegleria fowleri]
MVEHRTEQATGVPHTGEPTTKIRFQNPQTETAFQGLAGIREGVPPSNEAVLVGIEQAKQSVLSSHNLLDREGRLIQRDTLLLLDLIKMVIEERNSDEKIQNFLICFKNLTQKYAPEFGEDIRYGVKRGYETTQAGTNKDIYNSIIGLRDFVFELIRSSDFRQAMMDFFQYLQFLVDENAGQEGFVGKITEGIKSLTRPSDESTPSSSISSTTKHPTDATVVTGVGGSPQLSHERPEHVLLPSEVKSESDLHRNQGELSEPGQFSMQQGQQPYIGGSGIGQQQVPYQQTGFGQKPYSSGISQQQQPLMGGVSQQQPYSSGISEQPYQSSQMQGGEHLKSTSLYGSSHQGYGPLETGGGVSGGISQQHPHGLVSSSDQYREPSLQSNIQGGQFQPQLGGVGTGISQQPSGLGMQQGYGQQQQGLREDIPIQPQAQTASFQSQPHMMGTPLGVSGGQYQQQWTPQTQQQPLGIQQSGISGGLGGQYGGSDQMWHRYTPRWKPSNFQPKQDIFQQKDQLIREAEQVFNQFDLNKNGVLGRTEFKLALLRLGLDKYQAKMMGRIVDVDQNGLVSLNEFINAYLYIKAGGNVWDVPSRKKQGISTSGISQQPYIGSGISQQSGFGQQQYQQPWTQQQGTNIPPPPSTIIGGVSQSGGVGTTTKGQTTESKEEVEDRLINRFVNLNKRFSKDPNYQKALFGLFNIFNQAKSLVGEVDTTNKTVDRISQDEDFRNLLYYAKLIMYEFSDQRIFDKWLQVNNDFMIHLKTDERLKGVFKDLMNDFRRYNKQPELLESKQEKDNLRMRLKNCRTVLEEKKNMDLTNELIRSSRELLETMRNDELNAELRDRSQKLISRLFLDEKGSFTLKPHALEQIRTILFVAIQEAINNWNTIEVEGDDGTQYFKISNIVLKANDILPDDVKFKVKNRTSMNYLEQRPENKLAESATLVSAHLYGMTAHLKDVAFVFDRRSFPSLSDRGIMDIDFDRGGIDIKLKLKARLSQNRPFYVKDIKVGVDTLHIKFRHAEKHKLLLKMFSPIIQSRVRRKIHDNLQQSLIVNVREIIERLNDLIEDTIIKGNQMAGVQEGGIVTGILGRMGVSTTTTEGLVGSSTEKGYPSSTERVSTVRE